MIINIFKKTENDDRELIQTCMPESFIANNETKDLTLYFPDRPVKYKFDKIIIEYGKDMATVIL